MSIFGCIGDRIDRHFGPWSRVWLFRAQEILGRSTIGKISGSRDCINVMERNQNPPPNMKITLWPFWLRIYLILGIRAIRPPRAKPRRPSYFLPLGFFNTTAWILQIKWTFYFAELSDESSGRGALEEHHSFLFFFIGTHFWMFVHKWLFHLRTVYASAQKLAPP